MPRSEIDMFMESMADLESGGASDPYSATNPSSGAHGKWQIMPSNWEPWSKEAFGRVVSKSPSNQRQVARHKLLQYYDQFGDWDSVAVAWFAGPGRAQRLQRGDRSVLNMSDGNTQVGSYIETINRGLNRRRNQAGSQRPNRPGNPYSNPYSNMPQQQREQFDAGAFTDRYGPRQPRESITDDPSSTANLLQRNLLDSFTNLANRMAGGQRMSVDQIEAGQDLTPDDDMFSGADLMRSRRAIDDRIDMASSAVQTIISEATKQMSQRIQGAADLGTMAGMRAVQQAVSRPGDVGVPENATLDVEARPLAISENYEKGQALVDIASQYIGVPYKWGGTNPDSGLDCSGLIQLAAKQMGISIPRVSRDQAKAGSAVGSLDQARPGDLVAFASRGLPVGHIGIYVGNGKMLHAPRSGTNVRIDPIGNRKPVSIRRITEQGWQ